MHAVPTDALAEIEHAVAVRVCERFGLDTSSVALDMTNFATFIATGNDKAPIAQRGKAKQKRTDLRLVGLGLVVTRDGGIPLLSHTYPGDRPDVTQFPTMIKTLAARHADLAAAAGHPGTDMTVVFDAGQNSDANFADLAATGLHYVGSVPASDCPDLLALPAKARRPRPRLPGPDRHRHPPHRLRHRPAGDPDPLRGTARRPGHRVRGHHPGQGRPQAGRPGRHPGPRPHPPAPRQGRRRHPRHHQGHLGPPRGHLGTDRRQARRAAPDLARRPRRPRRSWKTNCSASTS